MRHEVQPVWSRECRGFSFLRRMRSSSKSAGGVANSEVSPAPVEDSSEGNADEAASDTSSQEAESDERKSTSEVEAAESKPPADSNDPGHAAEREGQAFQGSPGPQTSPEAHASPSDVKQNAVDPAKKLTGKLNKNVLIGIGVAVVAVIAIAVFMFMGGGPSDSLVKETIETEVSWPSAPDGEGSWKVDSIDIQSEKTVEAPGIYAGLLEGDVYEYTAVVKGSSDVAEGEQLVEVYFGKYEGEWQFMGCTAESRTFTPKAGVSEDSVLADKDSILSAAFSNGTSTELTLYADAEVSVGKIDFNKDDASCKTTVAYNADDAFSEAEAKIDVIYTFSENGTWELLSAVAKPGAGDVSYDKLVGTWRGAFEKTGHGKSAGADCYGARESTAELVITSVDSDSLKIEGTFTGMLHKHGNLTTTSNGTGGDEMAGPMPFTATLVESSYPYGKVGAEFTFPSDGGNTLQIEFGFGTNSDDDPNGAYIDLLYCYQCDVDDFFIPDPEEKWHDTYRLTKAE